MSSLLYGYLCAIFDPRNPDPALIVALHAAGAAFSAEQHADCNGAMERAGLGARLGWDHAPVGHWAA